MALNAGNEIENKASGIVVKGTAVEGGYFVTENIDSIPSYANKKGQLCYCIGDSKFYQCNGTSWEEKEFGDVKSVNGKTGTVQLTASDIGFSSSPDEYITENELNDKGYLTEHQSLAEYATETYVDKAIDSIEIPSIEGLATKEYVDDATKLKTINGESIHGDGNIEIIPENLNVDGLADPLAGTWWFDSNFSSNFSDLWEGLTFGASGRYITIYADYVVNDPSGEEFTGRYIELELSQSEEYGTIQNICYRGWPTNSGMFGAEDMMNNIEVYSSSAGSKWLHNNYRLVTFKSKLSEVRFSPEIVDPTKYLMWMAHHAEKINSLAVNVTNNSNINVEDISNELSKKLDKVGAGSGNRVYAVTPGGTQQMTGYTAVANAKTLMYRDENGNTKIATPTEDSHVANKKYVDDKAQTTLTNAKAYTDETATAIQTQLNGKQATLVSGTTIKTINNQNILGSGNIDLSGSSISSGLKDGDIFYTDGGKITFAGLNNSTNGELSFDTEYPITKNPDTGLYNRYILDTQTNTNDRLAPLSTTTVYDGETPTRVVRFVPQDAIRTNSRLSLEFLNLGKRVQCQIRCRRGGATTEDGSELKTDHFLVRGWLPTKYNKETGTFGVWQDIDGLASKLNKLPEGTFGDLIFKFDNPGYTAIELGYHGKYYLGVHTGPFWTYLEIAYIEFKNIETFKGLA